MNASTVQYRRMYYCNVIGNGTSWMPMLTKPATERRVSQSIPTNNENTNFFTKLRVTRVIVIFAKHNADGGSTENS